MDGTRDTVGFEGTGPSASREGKADEGVGAVEITCE